MIQRLFQIIFIVLPILGALNFPAVATAQSEFGFSVAHTYSIDQVVAPGDIISVQETKYLKSSTPYDTNVVGVSTDIPAVVFTEEDDPGMALLTEGLADVTVTTSNGEIHQGDYLTTSTIPGAAMKADTSGFVIGVAAADFSSSNPTELGSIPVYLQFTFIEQGETDTAPDKNYQRSLSDIFNLNRLAVSESPAQVLKYTIAALLLIASFGFGFYIFGKTANKGIDAMGRNPTAGKLIAFSVALNVLITVAIILAGVGLSYLIIMM